MVVAASARKVSLYDSVIASVLDAPIQRDGEELAVIAG